MFIRSLYQIGLGLVTIVTAPYLFWQWAFQGKYRGILAIRLGLKVPSFSVMSDKKCFWIHGVSLGEVKAAKAFIRLLAERYPDHQMFLSTLTNTGFQEALQIPQVTPFILPSDIHTGRLMRRLNPEALFLVEGDIWPNMVHAARRTIVVNGKISPHSASWYRFSFLRSLVIKPIDFWLVQSQIHQDRLKTLGVSPHRIQVTGDLKMAPDILLSAVYPQAGLMIVSTHAGEEELLLTALKSFEGLIFLAPRHPERFATVAALLEKMEIPYTRHSAPKPLAQGVVLIDAIGVLAPYYRAAPVTIVGGSFVVGIGGHNLLEPAFFGSIPVFGPHIEKQIHLKRILEKHELSFCTPITNLYPMVQQLWIGDKTTRLQALYHEGRTSLENTLTHVEHLLADRI